VKRLRLATRGSQLALSQAGWVARRVEEKLGVTVELVTVRTSGDRLADVSLAKIGGKGLFVKEIEEALLDGRADLAVHSAKDLPARIAEGLVLAAFPERADPRDALVTREAGQRLLGLPNGARVGTGSARRRAQLLALRPDFEVVALRGNVTTRLERLAEHRFDAVLLACAGLDRLDLGARIHERVSASLMLPAVGQGVLAIEARSGEALAADLAALSDPVCARAIAAERAFLARLEGDCNVPLAAFAEPAQDGGLRLRGMVVSANGARIARAEAAGENPERLGIDVAEAVLAKGGDEILAELRREATS
jgi:hydroxymethylbilane synthase